MSPKVSSTDISQAILQHVEVKAYPDSEELASADLCPDVLPTVIDAIGKERDKVKVCSLSSACLPFLLMFVFDRPRSGNLAVNLPPVSMAG
jgi:hypothetical protein